MTRAAIGLRNLEAERYRVLTGVADHGCRRNLRCIRTRVHRCPDIVFPEASLVRRMGYQIDHSVLHWSAASAAASGRAEPPADLSERGSANCEAVVDAKARVHGV